jgi:hypothetical protein
MEVTATLIKAPNSPVIWHPEIFRYPQKTNLEICFSLISAALAQYLFPHVLPPARTVRALTTLAL